MCRVGGARDGIRKLYEVVQPANGVEDLAIGQRLIQLDDVDRGMLVVQLNHGVIDGTVGRLVEILCASNDENNITHDLRIEEDRPQEAHLRLHRMGRELLEQLGKVSPIPATITPLTRRGVNGKLGCGDAHP